MLRPRLYILAHYVKCVFVYVMECILHSITNEKHRKDVNISKIFECFKSNAKAWF